MPPEAAEAAVEQTVEGTPAAPEQTPAPATPDQAPAKPTTTDAELRQLRAEFTRRGQKYSAVRKELGLDADASDDQLLAAVQALRQKAEQPEPLEDNGGITDPRYVELQRRAEEQLWRAQETVHGNVAQAGRELYAFMRRTSDPEAITDKMYEVLGRFAVEPETPGETPPAATGDGQPPEEEGQAQSFGLMDGGTRTGGPVVPTPEVTDEFRNTGNVRGYLEKLLAGRR